MIVSHENRDLGTFTKLSNRMSHIVDFTALLLPPGGLEAPEFFFHTMGGHLFHENDGKIPPPTVSCVLTNAGILNLIIAGYFGGWLNFRLHKPY